jgi:CheY-like chemotaxis protein
VAHDFNNLLMGIMGYTKLCQDGVAADHPVRQWLDEIMVETSRSADLVRQLLAFARKQVVARRNLDLNNQIGGTLKMLRRLIGERVELTWSPAAEPSIVNADSSQIDQILANLCVNATDAIANTGRIDIATRNLSMDASACAALPGMKPGDHVLLTVSDSGCGMDSETQAHAFEPFFTTKGVGQGTGLGLATVYGIVQQSDGFIGLDSTPGRGTTFSIYFPVVARAESPDAEAPDTGPLPGGKETILLVDDEKSIRVPTAAYLERLGYSVLTADSPEAAIHLAQEHPAVIDLLLSDMVMPGMSGVDLRNHLLSARPAMKSVFMTGYTTRQFDPCPGSAGETVCLMKPVPILDLAVAIRAALSPGSTGKQ